MSSLLKWSARILATVGILYTAAIGIIAVFQDKMVYVPRVPGMATEFIYTPASYHLSYEDVYLTAEDGVRIHAWMIWPNDWDAKRRATRPVVLFFQENAGNMQYRLYFIRDMVHYLQCSVLAVRYVTARNIYRPCSATQPRSAGPTYTHCAHTVTEAMVQAKAPHRSVASSSTQQQHWITCSHALTATWGVWWCMDDPWGVQWHLHWRRHSHTRCVVLDVICFRLMARSMRSAASLACSRIH